MTPLILLAGRVILFTVDPTPTPVPTFEGDESLVTPGVVGFAVTFAIAIATVLLVIDMTRRVRRVRYRAEVQERLAAEQAAAADGTAERPAEASEDDAR